MFPEIQGTSPQNLPLPLLVAQKWQFPLQYHLIDGEYWFAVQDWIRGLTTTDEVRMAWAKMQEQIQTLISIQPLAYKATDNKIYQRDFTNDKGLYLIAQNLRATKNRPLLSEIKQFLAKAGAFVDLARREPETLLEALDPDKALEAVVDYYRRQGKDDNWISTRLNGIISRHKFTAALKNAVVDLLKSHYAIATNEVYLGLWQRTAQQLKEEMGLTARQNLRDHQPRLGLLYQDLAEETCASKLGTRQELSFAEAALIIRQVAELIGSQAQMTSNYLGLDVATGKPLLAAGQA